MANPKRRHSNSRTRTRRAHDAIDGSALSKCSNCGAKKVPHSVCPKCGFYKGKRIVTIKVKASKEEKGEK